MSATEPDDTIHQIVFRWQGNQGRRGAGMAAAAWSCSPERAEELSRELAPLLRVDGAVRPSLVRTLTKRKEVAVIRRWPTADPGGRPNTACHLLLSQQPDLLGPRLSLALNGWTFGTQRFAEQATDRCDPVPRSLLRSSAKQVWDDTPTRIAEVREALTVATAALLRRPGHRLSLRADALPGWPEWNRSAAVISGLYEIFGHTWLPQQWTFATYDVTDRHDLMVTWVTDWATDSGQQHPRSRVDPRRPEPGLAHDLAGHLVGLYLDRPQQQEAGLPELHGKGLRDAAAWTADERLRRLAHVLGVNSGSRRQSGRAEPPRPGRSSGKPTEHGVRPDESRDDFRDDFGVLGPDHPAERPAGPASWPDDPSPRHHQDTGGDSGPRHGREPAERHTPQPDPAPTVDPEGGVYTRPSRAELRRELEHPGDVALADLHRLTAGADDRFLLEILREEDLLDVATKRLLRLLEGRRAQRTLDEEHLLCTEVLGQCLYLYRTDQARPGHHAAFDDHLVNRAVWLFDWAVAPYTRDPRHREELHALLTALLRNGTEVERELLRRLIPPPGAGGPVPDLPPELWRHLLYELPAGALTPQPLPQPSGEPHTEPPADPPAPPREQSRRQLEEAAPPDPTQRARTPHPPTTPPAHDPRRTAPRRPDIRPGPPPSAAPASKPPPDPAEPDPPGAGPAPGPRHAAPPTGPSASPRVVGPPTPKDQQAQNILLVFGLGAALIAVLILAIVLA
ncbi:hypothetical protein ACWC9T_09045 [Kitasatospora sp. NPDC001159]